MAMLVDRALLAISQHDGWITVQYGDATFEIGRGDRVVVALPLEVSAPGELEGDVVVSGGTQILLIAGIADALVPRDESPADFRRGIRGGVVGDDQLQIRVGLPKDGLDRLLQEAPTVVHRQTDADGWMMTFHSIPRVRAGR